MSGLLILVQHRIHSRLIEYFVCNVLNFFCRNFLDAGINFLHRVDLIKNHQALGRCKHQRGTVVFYNGLSLIMPCALFQQKFEKKIILFYGISPSPAACPW